MKAQKGVEVELQSILTSALDEVGVKRQASAVLPAGKSPGTLRTGGWVGPSCSGRVWRIQKPLALTFRTPTAVPTTLSWLPAVVAARPNSNRTIGLPFRSEYSVLLSAV